MKKQTDRRFRQANREALIALVAYGVYFVWWYVFGYGMGDTDPDTYSYVFGFPAWFFYSCIAGYPVITVLLWVLVRKFFKEMPLDAEEPESMSNEEINR
ncbi:YhdT family protein [Pseudodesulfovibrio sp. zrk46]|uniref:YhdT family protein n=1 Tax=Pseudodesulfovibrio sp. zrk46 TaxID=2725288 RepID=UPI001448CE76|nr:YhdT family protein [Pseudodesulfovibrio sp. zrk46]QJB57096.1 YhdT family protein [Pseudodesulfovibrio sp. zrk46]